MESYANTNCANKAALTEALKLAEKMLKLAEKGMLICEDDSCLMLYGTIRDCGYKILRTVEEEKFCVLQRGGRHRILN
jgi:hypothetical protein